MTRHRQLQRKLGLPFAIAVCVGTVVGTGIMRAPGEIANLVPDPTIVMMLWLAGGLYVLLMCNVAAEISSMICALADTIFRFGKAWATAWAFWSAGHSG